METNGYKKEPFNEFVDRMKKVYHITFEVEPKPNDVAVSLYRNGTYIETVNYPMNYLFSQLKALSRNYEHYTYLQKRFACIKLAVRLTAKKYNFC